MAKKVTEKTRTGRFVGQTESTGSLQKRDGRSGRFLERKSIPGDFKGVAKELDGRGLPTPSQAKGIKPGSEENKAEVRPIVERLLAESIKRRRSLYKALAK